MFKLLDDGEWKKFWIASVAKKHNCTELKAEKICHQISVDSLDVGNALHKYAEVHLNNDKIVEIQTDREYPVDLNSLFEPLHNHLNEHIDNIHGIEIPIYSDELELAGTSDCIAEYDGVLSIIDFKNSRKMKTKSECEKRNYFTQLCAYSKMWEFCTGEKIKQGVIIVISWDGKLKAFKINIDDYETDLWKKLILIEKKL